MSEPEEDLQKAYDHLERDWNALMAVKGSVFRYCYDSLPGPEGPASIEAKGHMDACLDVLDILDPQWREKP